jgi:DNA-binding NtrC family response regulator
MAELMAKRDGVSAGLADGQEVLVVDGDEKVQHGLQQLLGGANLVPTVVAVPAHALELVSEKFFAVALVDLDTPTVGAGVGLIAQLHARSPATTVLMMAARRNFDVAVAAFRAGAADVIVKTPDQVDYLRGRVIEAAAARRLEADRSRVVDDTLALHEDLMRVLLENFRRARHLEEKSGGGTPLPVEDTAVLVVDDDYAMQSQLGAALVARGGFVLRSASSGGEAIDLASRERFAIALVRETLPDLPGTMVVRTIKTQAPDTITLLHRAPTGGSPGRVDVMEGSKAIAFLPEFTSPSQILERLDELRDAARATQHERRHLAAFRQEHFDLLKRYAELRQRLQRSSAGK